MRFYGGFVFHEKVKAKIGRMHNFIKIVRVFSEKSSPVALFYTPRHAGRKNVLLFLF
jgi:hypothetical protein